MKPTAHIVMLGLDVQKKPHAAKFDAAQAELVRKAAVLMGMRVGWPKTEEAVQLAARLIPGKLFAAGRGLVPLVKAATYEVLVQKLELEPETKAPDKASASPATQSQPKSGPATGAPTSASPAPPTDPWAAIKIGSTVIAPERNAAEEGWWRCVVTAVSKDGTKLTLRWLDAPKQPPVTLKRHAVALLYPS